jgi:hypothetical protein
MGEPAEPPAVTSQRWQVVSLDHWFDDVMAGIPHRTMALDQPEVRARLRSYLKVRVGHLMSALTDAYRKGAERGIDQAATLVRDPAYYQTIGRRRAAERKQWAEDLERQKREALEYRDAQAAELKALRKAGKVALFPGLAEGRD